MEGRWANAVQPTAIPVVDAAQRNIAFYIHDPERIGVGSRIDIYPGESEPLDIAIRFESNPNCYGWNNETYFKEPFGKNPDWTLGRGCFLVKASVNSTGKKCERVFRLINEGPYDAARLEKASPKEESVIAEAMS